MKIKREICMNLSPVSNLNFKGYIPVRYYAVNKDGKTTSRILSKENLKKCNGRVVRNLNGTIKNKNEDLINSFKSLDKDYKKDPYVASIYDYNNSTVYLATGCDARRIDEMAKPIGIAKGEAKRKTGKAKSYESSYAANEYFKNVKEYITKRCKRLKSANGENLSLKILFTPKYTREGKLKDFELTDSKFIEE